MKTGSVARARALFAATLLASSCRAVPAHADYEPNKYTEPGTNLVLEYNLYVPDVYPMPEFIAWMRRAALVRRQAVAREARSGCRAH